LEGVPNGKAVAAKRYERSLGIAFLVGSEKSGIIVGGFDPKRGNHEVWKLIDRERSWEPVQDMVSRGFMAWMQNLAPIFKKLSFSETRVSTIPRSYTRFGPYFAFSANRLAKIGIVLVC
jgi:hypothetical protein